MKLIDIECKHQFEIEFPSGCFFDFDLDINRVVCYCGSKETEAVNGIDSDEIEGDCKLIFASNDKSALLVNVYSDKIYKLKTVDPILECIIKLSRTDLYNEGFDYLEIVEINEMIVILYEHGIVGFDKNIKYLCEINLDSLMVRPIIEGKKIIYSENYGDVIYEVEGKNLVKK